MGVFFNKNAENNACFSIFLWENYIKYFCYFAFVFEKNCIFAAIKGVVRPCAR